jgi:hypothetical protein
LEDLLMTAPLRKIVHTCKDSRRTRRGIIQLSTLECSHQEWTNAGERKAGKGFCFDCFYNKPASAQGMITLECLAGFNPGITIELATALLASNSEHRQPTHKVQEAMPQVEF